MMTTRNIWQTTALLFAGLWNFALAREVELGEIFSPSYAGAFGTDADPDCPPEGCLGILTRDGSLSDSSAYACSLEESCSVEYYLTEDISEETVELSRVLVAFRADSRNAVDVLMNGELVVTWEAVEGTEAFQEIPGLSGSTGSILTLSSANDDADGVFAILEVDIYVEVDAVPFTGIYASDRVDVTVSATVNEEDAAKTRDLTIGADSVWECRSRDVCEITYDLQSPQSIEQVHVAFLDVRRNQGATFNLYFGTETGIFSMVLEGIDADSSDWEDGIRVLGNARGLGRFVKIEGVTGSGGRFYLSEVYIRLNEDEPQYSTSADPTWVESGLLPLGVATGADPRPASEGGCSHGNFVGCDIYNIKDGVDTEDSRWSCSPTVRQGASASDVCVARFDLNTYRYVRQIKLAFHKGDERHREFAVWVSLPWAWVVAIPSAITSGDTTDFETYDLPAWTSTILIIPQFNDVNEWFSVKELVILEEEQPASSSPVLSFINPAEGPFNSENVLQANDLKEAFGFDLDAGDEAVISVGGSGQVSGVTALMVKFPDGQSFTFEVSYFNADDEEIVDTFTSAGGAETFEEFTLSQVVETNVIYVTAVEGPDVFGVPDWRNIDLMVIGTVVSPVKHVVSTTIAHWGMVPDYIGDGSGDQEEIQTAICDAAGLEFDGFDCEGDVSAAAETANVELVQGEYFLDGPVFLKSGVDLLGTFSEDSPFQTEFIIHVDGTPIGVDGVVNADEVTDVLVREIAVRSNVENGDVPGVVGNVCYDFKGSSEVSISGASMSCPIAGARIEDLSNLSFENYFGFRSFVSLKLADEVYIGKALFEEGLLIEDCTNVFIEGLIEDDTYMGAIYPQEFGSQVPNLLITGTTSGVHLKNMDIASGEEPRVLIENTNTVTLEAVDFFSPEPDECLIQVPPGAPDDIIVQIDPVDLLVRSGDCYILA